MTTRNLNKTWRDVVWDQYEADFEADVLFPVRYLIHASEWKRDIFITIPNKITHEDFRRAVLDFLVATRRVEKREPIWENELISVRPRVKPPIPEEVKIGPIEGSFVTLGSEHVGVKKEDDSGPVFG